MPIIKVFGLPERMEEKDIVSLWEEIRSTVASVEELRITEEQVTVYFPSDRLKTGLGEEVTIEVTGLFEKSERTPAVRRQLAEKLGRVVKKVFPLTLVECFVKPFDPRKGFWTSESEQTAT